VTFVVDFRISLSFLFFSHLAKLGIASSPQWRYPVLQLISRKVFAGSCLNRTRWVRGAPVAHAS
jgi:hypothetical protein